MNRTRVAWAGACLAVVVTMMATNVSTVLAQRDAGAKARGEMTFWGNDRVSRRMQHARDYSRGLYQYSRDARKIEPAVAKSESEELGRNIEAAKKELSTVRKEAASDKETLAALTVIEEHLDKAAKQHQMLHAECCKKSVDGGVCAECCNVITKELEKALAEHAALVRKLELKAQHGGPKSPPAEKAK